MSAPGAAGPVARQKLQREPMHGAQEGQGFMSVASRTAPLAVAMSAAEQVYLRTRRGIMEGTYPPGTRLTIRDLAQDNAVSTIPVREALIQLAVEGWVEMGRNRAPVVARFDPEGLRDIYETRAVLEVEALRRAFPRITDAIVAEARALNAEMAQLVERGDERFFEVHQRLHFLLLEQSRSEWLMRLTGMVWGHSERYRWLSTPHGPARAAVRSQHEPVLDALATRDEAAALDALRGHIMENCERLLEAVDSFQPRSQ